MLAGLIAAVLLVTGYVLTRSSGTAHTVGIIAFGYGLGVAIAAAALALGIDPPRSRK